ncbi:hypothetical protein ACJROX_16280 [Pseudalkalibacillus sp. A8]|uniref:hypothetical protein n=1 Tax=Pseudalkalibacillus sp. A8 TaxID=3382641 RepID=UPI0038B45D04
MGSRIMHLITADMVLKELSIKSENDFLLGSVIPDAVIPKDLSHFFEYDSDGLTISVNYPKFAVTYKNVINEPLTLGYLCHLITDDIWLKDFYLSWIKEEIEADDSFYYAYHRDFRRFNYHLLQHHGNFQLEERLASGRYFDFYEELNHQSVKQFLLSMEEDFKTPSCKHKETFEVFQFDDIVRYLEKSKQESIKYLQSFISTKGEKSHEFSTIQESE